MMQLPNTQDIRGSLMLDVPLTRYNTWGLSGHAECLYQPYDLADLSHFLQQLDANIPVTYIGLGSNLLIRDGGVSGVVIVTHACLKNIQYIEPSDVYVQAGVACAKLAKFTGTKNLTGIEFMAGIPGTVGGALAMNAGAFAGQTWDYVDYVDVINRQGDIYSRRADEYQTSYREVSVFDDEYFVGAHFILTHDSDAESSTNIRQLLEQRSRTQPIGKKNCGSVFKNPENAYAAELIEQCGLKGYRIGGASISAKHANFINNDANASAEDIEALMEYAQQKVFEKFSIQLEPEVRTIGERCAG